MDNVHRARGAEASRYVHAALTTLATFLCLYVLSIQATAIRDADPPLMLYASVGARLMAYEADPGAATLVERGSVTLPAYVQEAWAHPSKPVLYVAWSNGGALYAPSQGGATRAPTESGITTFRIDAATGTLRTYGESTALRTRPIYITCDAPCQHLFAAYPDPSGISVHNIRDDGTLGGEVVQPNPLDVGIYAHQVRVAPTNNVVVLVTRGNEPTADPNGGVAFRSRHVDFHPTRPWVFLTLEAQNKQTGEPRRVQNIETHGIQPRTFAIDPSGRMLVVANQTSMAVRDGSAIKTVPANLAVFRIDRAGHLTFVRTYDVTAGREPLLWVGMVARRPRT